MQKNVLRESSLDARSGAAALIWPGLAGLQAPSPWLVSSSPETSHSQADSFAAVLQGLSIAIAVVALAGWAIPIAPVLGLFFPVMNPVIACGLLAAGVASLLLRRNETSSLRIDVGSAVAAGVVSLGVLKLCSHWFHWNLHIDGWLFGSELAAHPRAVNQFAPKTGFAFVLIGGAMLLRRAKFHRFAEIFSFSVVAIGVLSVQGYAFGMLELQTAPGFVPMTVPTGICVLLAGSALLLDATQQGAMRILASGTAGGLLARRLLPLAILLSTALGTLRIMGARAGWYDADFGAALFTTAFIVIFLLVTWWTVRLLHRLDLTRESAEVARSESEERVRGLNSELKQRVDERTAALEIASTANRELDAFSYSVSHDLRVPLRAISSFARTAAEDHASALGKDGVRCLERVQQGTRQMEQLVEDLLLFSRTGRQALSRTRVDMSELVAECVADLEAMRNDRQVTIKVADLAPCAADAALVRQVWSNLLSNALKYTRRRASAFISIGSETRAEGVVYFVQDNGSGFDMKYAHKLFGVFQRLHSEDEYEGTGVGLALVQRIVHRHGGDVWAEAEAGRGATFSFTLQPRSAAPLPTTQLS